MKYAYTPHIKVKEVNIAQDSNEPTELFRYSVRNQENHLYLNRDTEVLFKIACKWKTSGGYLREKKLKKKTKSKKKKATHGYQLADQTFSILVVFTWS